jgi:hypothetical protein
LPKALPSRPALLLSLAAAPPFPGAQSNVGLDGHIQFSAVSRGFAARRAVRPYLTGPRHRAFHLRLRRRAKHLYRAEQKQALML